MAAFVLGLLIFLGVHSTRIVADGWRGRQVARLGLRPWKALYAVASLAGLLLLLWGYGQVRHQSAVLWTPPAWTHHVTALLVLVAFILIVAAYLPGTHIKAAVGHPMLAAVKTWAFAHLLANGTVADVILFGAFLVWAILGYRSARRRDRAAGTTYPAKGWSRDALAAVVGVLAWGWFADAGHALVIGVHPFA